MLRSSSPNYAADGLLASQPANQVLTYSVTWNSSNSQFHTVSGNKVANTVTVTVTYHWIPEAFLGGITLSSTSVCVMSY